MPLAPTVRLALRPRWWAWHLALVAVLVAFGWLGWWQLDSFEDAAPAARPVGRWVAPLDAVTGPGGRLEAADVGRRVRVTGTWEPAGQVVVPDRERAGRPGTLVVTPLRTADGIVPVVRGWLPAARPASAARPPEGPVTVTGVLQRSETEADATAVTGTLPRGQIGYVATVTLLAALPYDAAELYDGFVVLRAQAPPGDGTDALRLVAAAERSAPGGVGRWRNLAYGLQWWVFAGAAVVFWAAVLRRAGREGQPPDPPPDGADGPPPPLVAPRRTT